MVKILMWGGAQPAQAQPASDPLDASEVVLNPDGSEVKAPADGDSIVAAEPLPLKKSPSYFPGHLTFTGPWFRSIVPPGRHRVEVQLEGGAKFGTVALANALGLDNLSQTLVVDQNGQCSYPNKRYEIVYTREAPAPDSDATATLMGAEVTATVLVDGERHRTFTFINLSERNRVRNPTVFAHLVNGEPHYEVDSAEEANCTDCLGRAASACTSRARAASSYVAQTLVGFAQGVRHPVTTLNRTRGGIAYMLLTPEQKAMLNRPETAGAEQGGHDKSE